MPSPVPVGVGQTTRLGPCAGRGVRPHAETHAPGMCVNTPQARSPTPPSGCAWWSGGGRGAPIPSDHPCGARPPRSVTAAASWRRPPSGARARAVPLSPLHRRSTRPLDRPPRPVSAMLWAPDGTGQDCAEPTHPNSTGPRVATVKDVLARCAASQPRLARAIHPIPPSRTPKATHVLYAVQRRGPGPVSSPPSQPMAPNTRVASTLVPASPRRRRRLLRNRRGRLHGRGGGGPPAAPKGHVRALPKPLGPHRLARCRRRSEALVRPAVTAAPYPGRGELVLAHTRRAARAGRRVKQKARTQADSKTPRTGRTSVRTEKWMTRTVDRSLLQKRFKVGTCPRLRIRPVPLGDQKTI